MTPSRSISDAEGLLERLEWLLGEMARLRVLVVGDIMLDAYIFGDVDRISPEAPVPVVRAERETAALGGAANVAQNVVALGARCLLAGTVGNDASGEGVQKLALDGGIDPSGLVVERGRVTPTKTRIVARGQQLVRVDREAPSAIAEASRLELGGLRGACLSHVDGVILADYAKGELGERDARDWIASCRATGIPVAVDPKNRLAGYEHAQLIKPNRQEAFALAGLRQEGGSSLEAVLMRLGAFPPAREWAITDGSRGMWIAGPEQSPMRVPTEARDIFDVQGAGDTAIAALALARWAGGTLCEAALIANAAAAVAIGKMGTAAAPAADVAERLPHVVAAFRAIAHSA